MPLCLSLLADLYGPHERTVATSLLAMASGIGTGTGQVPLISSHLILYLNFKWIPFSFSSRTEESTALLLDAFAFQFSLRMYVRARTHELKNDINNQYK